MFLSFKVVQETACQFKCCRFHTPHIFSSFSTHAARSSTWCGLYLCIAYRYLCVAFECIPVELSTLYESSISYHQFRCNFQQMCFVRDLKFNWTNSVTTRIQLYIVNFADMFLNPCVLANRDSAYSDITTFKFLSSE